MKLGRGATVSERDLTLGEVDQPRLRTRRAGEGLRHRSAQTARWGDAAEHRGQLNRVGNGDLHDIADGGDHSVVVGHVTNLERAGSPGAEPLLFYAGAYRSLGKDI